MTKRIFRSMVLVALAVFLASLVFIMGALYSHFSDMQQNQLKMQAQLAAQGVAHEGTSYFDGLETDDYRITWIDTEGQVLYDSDSDATDMENHLDREEVQEALDTGCGESSRYSDTMTRRLLYIARRLPDGTVIRLACAQQTPLTLILSMLQPILLVMAVAIALSLLLSFRVSKKILQPLSGLDLDAPLANTPYEELKPLLARIDSQQKQLKRQNAQLRRKQNEFEAATDNMNEGLVLLNDQGIILSINRTASRLFSVSPYCIGKDIRLVNDSLPLQELLQKAQNGERGETAMPLGELEYQVNASPVISDHTVSGIVLLIFDITDKEKAEQMRREFTANVSHELKTPLHAISGYAELLKNGMVQPEDVGHFSGRIYAEAQRLIVLVEDIIRLSHLDEGAQDMPAEEVDLLTVAQKAILLLEAEAAAAGVTVTLHGTAAPMQGIPQLLSGIVFNLCDNAIKYNRENGSVSVEVQNTGDVIVLTVSDTGIGIPPEHHERIFERFYRVDKSHSKEVGGTGLGLSIVKHSAMLHNATVELHSVPNGGTTVTVRFPR